MKIEDARAIVDETITQRQRFGQQFTAADIGAEKILDALVVLREYGEDGSEVTAARRAEGAAKAREKKWKLKLDDAVREKEQTVDLMDELEERLRDSQAAVRAMRGQLDAYMGSK